MVKRYADEVDAERVRSLTDIVVSALARVEVPGAFWRKYRAGDLTAGDAGILTAAFEWEWFEQPETFAVVDVTDEILDRAAQATAVHGLRAFDAIQFATAVAARAADPDLTIFACFDHELANAAQREGFTTVP